MKISEIRFKNLNSLAGEWVIDLESPHFKSEGIFAIIGPTGSGKTTILDAICLALYGETPRISSISNKTNEIMTRGQKDCWAEIIFSVRGKKYLSQWSHRRAQRKGATNPFGEAQHKLSEITDDDGKAVVLAEKITEKRAKVQEITGMAFDQFTRSVLLAQGAFASFLQANSREKAPLLEMITGTELYSEISKKVHQKTSEEKQKLTELTKFQDQLSILSPEEEQIKKEELNTVNQSIVTLEENKIITENLLSWLEELEKLIQERQDLEKSLEKHENEVQAFQEHNKRLALAEKANICKPFFDKVQERKNAIDGFVKEKEIVDKEQSLIKAEISENDGKLQGLLSTLKEIETLVDGERVTSRTIRELDTKIHALQENWGKNKVDLQGRKLEKDKEESQLEILKKKQEEYDAQLLEIWSSLEDDEKIFGLSQNYSEIIKEIEKLKGLTNQLSHFENIKQKLSAESEDNQKNTELLEKGKNFFADALKEKKGLIHGEKVRLDQILDGKSLDDYQRLKARIEEDYIKNQTIKSLDDLRKQLADNQPCPLCGSRDHPYALGNIPCLSSFEQEKSAIHEKIKEIEKIGKFVLELEKELNNIETESNNCHIRLESLQQNFKKNRRDFTENQEQLADLLKSLLNCKESLKKWLEPFDEINIDKDGVEGVETFVQRQIQGFNKLKKNREDILKVRYENKSEFDKCSAIIHEKAKELAIKELEFGIIDREINQMKARRFEIYQDKNPDDEEAKLEVRLQENKKKAEDSRNELYRLKDRQNKENARFENLEKLLNEHSLKLEEEKKEFEASLINESLVDEKAFLDSLLKREELENLRRRARELEDEKLTLLTLKSKNQAQYQGKKDENKTDISKEELLAQQQEYKLKIGEENDKKQAISVELRKNDDEKTKFNQQLSKINAQKNEYERWKMLDELIGSSDGQKYSQFVQGLTFQMVVNHANEQLKKMTDRYLLFPDPENNLELLVLDDCFADELRTVKNLSGGESFIVSLALALGLSNMISYKTRIDSLFLDEGFGTLDDAALDSALEVLSNIRQEGKTIGLISHVAALKERIGAQISVEIVKKGKSRLRGPGITGNNS